MQIVKIEAIGLEQAAVMATEAMRGGRIIVYPTDTVYGFGVDAQNAQAVKRVRDMKGRDPKIPLSVAMRDMEMVKDFCRVSPIAQALMEQHFPGPFTFVLAVNDTRMQATNTEAIGVRIPKSAFTDMLSKVFNAPYVTTSANISGTPPLTTVEKIVEVFGKLFDPNDLIFDEGVLLGLPSTVVDLTTDNPRIIRNGVGLFTP